MKQYWTWQNLIIEYIKYLPRLPILGWNRLALFSPLYWSFHCNASLLSSCPKQPLPHHYKLILPPLDKNDVSQIGLFVIKWVAKSVKTSRFGSLGQSVYLSVWVLAIRIHRSVLKTYTIVKFSIQMYLTKSYMVKTFKNDMMINSSKIVAIKQHF